jgi:hypothetical protein
MPEPFELRYAGPVDADTGPDTTLSTIETAMASARNVLGRHVKAVLVVGWVTLNWGASATTGTVRIRRGFDTVSGTQIAGVTVSAVASATHQLSLAGIDTAPVGAAAYTLTASQNVGSDGLAGAGAIAIFPLGAA